MFTLYYLIRSRVVGDAFFILLVEIKTMLNQELHGCWLYGEWLLTEQSEVKCLYNVATCFRRLFAYKHNNKITLINRRVFMFDEWAQ